MAFSKLLCKLGFHTAVTVKGLISVDVDRRVYVYFGDCPCGKSYMFEYKQAVQGGDIVYPRKKLERL